MKPSRIITGVIISAILCSCIKENRENCPCFLSIDFSQVDTQKVESVHIWFADALDKIVGSAFFDKTEYDTYEAEVPRGATYIYCWGNISPADVNLHVFPNIRSKVYFYKNKIYSNGEFAADTVKMKREYMGLSVKVIGNILPDSDFSISVESSSAGYYISGEIMEGVFKFSPEAKIVPTSQNSYYEYNFNIIRQKNPEDLRLHLISGSNGTETLIYDYPLGESLMLMGIDMKASELGDVALIVDFSYLETKITIEPWNGTKRVEIII